MTGIKVHKLNGPEKRYELESVADQESTKERDYHLPCLLLFLLFPFLIDVDELVLLDKSNKKKPRNQLRLQLLE